MRAEEGIATLAAPPVDPPAVVSVLISKISKKGRADR